MINNFRDNRFGYPFIPHRSVFFLFVLRSNDSKNLKYLMNKYQLDPEGDFWPPTVYEVMYFKEFGGSSIECSSVDIFCLLGESKESLYWSIHERGLIIPTGDWLVGITVEIDVNKRIRLEAITSIAPYVSNVGAIPRKSTVGEILPMVLWKGNLKSRNIPEEIEPPHKYLEFSFKRFAFMKNGSPTRKYRGKKAIGKF